MSLGRVLMVCEPGEYGVLIYLRKLVAFLQAHHPDLRLDLAYSSRRGSTQQRQLIAGIEERGGRTLDLGVGNGPEPADVSAGLRLARLIRETRPDLIHAHSTKAGALVRLRALGPGCPPVLYSPHGYYGMARRGGAKERLFNGVEMVLGRVGCTHNVSPHERRFALEVLRVPPASTVLVMSGVNLEVFRPVSPERRLELRRMLGLPEAGKLLVTVGREGYEKNQIAIYRALPQALAGRDRFFAHAGDGAAALRDTLDPGTRQKVFVFPYLDRPEELLQAADGFVMTSRSEAFGLAAYEALGCGLPLLLTATTGLLTLRDLHFDSVTWLPNPAEREDITAELVAAIEAWANAPRLDPTDQVRRAAEWFDERVQFEKLVDLYRDLGGR